MSYNIRELVSVLELRFVNRSDTYGIQQKDNSYRRKDKTLTEQVILQHLAGKITIGVYQLDPKNNFVKWVCFDIDPERIPTPQKVAKSICEEAVRFFSKNSVVLEASRYPDESYHIWILFDPSISAKTARKLGQKILEKVGLEKLGIEIFPKQEKIEEDGFGNLVKLPLGVHQQQGKRSQLLNNKTFEPLPNEYILELQACEVPESEIRETSEDARPFSDPVPDLHEKSGYSGKDPVCIEKLLKGVKEGDRNEFGIRLASYWLNFCGFSADKVWNLIKKWNCENSPLLPMVELQSIMRSAIKGGYTFGCDDKILKSLCPGKKECILFKSKREEKVVRTPFVELPNQVLCEQAFDGNSVFYLVYDTKTGSVEKRETIGYGGCLYVPIDNGEVREKLVLLPAMVDDFGDLNKLVREIEDFLNKWHEAPDEESRKLDVYYVFLTYVKDLVPQIPYRRILGSWGKGKSAWLETLGWISYRGTILSGSNTEKSIVRRMNLWQGTAIIDEADFGDSTFYSFITKILNVGYDQKFGFYQRCDDEKSEKTITYNVYGPKILATRSRYKDKALESRCLTTIGRENTRPVPLFRMDNFFKEAQLLRNKLICWRFKNYYRIKKEAAKFEDPEMITEIFGKDSKISSRIKQIVLPLWLVGGEKIRAGIKEFAAQFDEKIKLEDPDYALELKAKEAVIAVLEEKSKVSFGGESADLMNLLMDAYGNPEIFSLELREISEKFLELEGNQDINRKKKIGTSRILKRIFELRLGFKVILGPSRSRTVIIPSSWIINGYSKDTSTKEDSEDSQIPDYPVFPGTDMNLLKG